MDQSAHLILRVPLPNVDIDERELYAIKESFRREGCRIKLSAEDEFPVSESWAALEIAAGLFAAGVVATHYIEKILDAFDGFVKAKIDVLNLKISIGSRHVYRDVQLRDRNAAKKAIADALFELEAGLNRQGAVVYWVCDAVISEAGTITFKTSGWRDGTCSSSLVVVQDDSADYVFWSWLLRRARPDAPITDEDVEKLRKEFEMQDTDATVCRKQQ